MANGEFLKSNPNFFSDLLKTVGSIWGNKNPKPPTTTPAPTMGASLSGFVPVLFAAGALLLIYKLVKK